MGGGNVVAEGVEIFGHRGWGFSGPGALADVPENSIAALEKAANQKGCHGAEIDVWMTNDGHVVVIHGGGPRGRGLLWETTCVDTAQHTRGIQEMSLAELHASNAFMLKEAWPGLNVDCPAKDGESSVSKTEHCRLFHQMSEEGQQRVRDDWHNHRTECHLGCKMPLLSEVFERFAGRLVFNVELKGTDQRLGPKVLEIARPFTNIIARISSFCWVPPASAVSGLTPSSRPTTPLVDLLKPIVDNPDKVPLALLFERAPVEPQVAIDCLDAYKSKWAHFRQESWQEVPESECRKTPAERFAHLTGALRNGGYLVMAWWNSRSIDKADDIKIALNAGVDSICPNDVALAIQVLQEWCASKGRGSSKSEEVFGSAVACYC